MGGDGRERLFLAYGTLCEIMIDGVFAGHVPRLEALCQQIATGNHSIADKIRARLVYARALVLGASTSSLRESDLLKARSILNEEFYRAMSHSEAHLACLIGLELARSYLLCSPHEVVVLTALVSHIRDVAADDRVFPELRFDIQRMAYHLLAPAKSDEEVEVVMADLRRMALPLGAVSRALAELSISRRLDVADSRRAVAREKALLLFEESRFSSGIFEILHTEGLVCLAKKANSEAARCFAQATHQAEANGCSYGVVLGSLGALQASLAIGSDDASHHVDRIRGLMRSDIALGTAGLGTVAAMQVAGRLEDAIKLASRCEKFFRERALEALESQAVFMLGSAHALSGQWAKAKTAWRRGVSVDIRRQAPLAAAERRAALAQAIAMEEFSATSTISAASMSKVQKLLEDADRAVAACGDTLEAIRARARVLQTHAQLCMIAQLPVGAVKHLSSARDLYAAHGLTRDVALADALLGLAMLEVAKLKGGRLYEESIVALQRSLDFFSGTQHAHIRWKLKYYLAIAALMSSRTKSESGQRNHWMQSASTWLKGAMDDVSTANAAGTIAGSEGDFSPGLGVQALESLSAAIQQKPMANRPRLLKVATRTKRAVRQVH
jgi:tetratricopeptide (TPR) repeat protein